MEITRRALLAASTGLLAAAGRPCVAAANKEMRFRITALPLLPGGDYSSVCAINNAGQAVGLSSTGRTIVSGLLRDTRAVQWHGNSVRDLVGQKFMAPQGNRINDRGQILLNWQYIGADRLGSVPPPEDYAVLWDGTVRKVWRQHDGFIPTTINNHGDIAGRSARDNWRAALWRGDKAMPIAFPADVVSSQALAVNDALMVTGTYSRGQDHGEEGLFIWQKGRLDTVPSDGARSAYYPAAVNTRGQVVGIYRETDTRIAHLFTWESGKLVDCGALGRDGIAHGINQHGDMVGRADWGAFLATGGVILKLYDLIPADSGWTLNAATSINDQRHIVGNGQFQGQWRAFFLIPETAEV